MSEQHNRQLEPVSIVLIGLSASAEAQVRAAIPEKLGRQFRAMKMVDGGYDPDKHTVTLALSSDEPIDRGYAVEILNHEKGAIRTDRLDHGIPLLFNHDMDQHLGTSLSWTITGGILRLVYQFGPSPLAKEKEADVAARILKDTSVGYQVYKWNITEDDKGNRTMEALDWEPHEGSLVTVPADITGGVGRAAAGDEVTVVITTRKAKKVEPEDDDDEDEDDDEQDDPDEEENPDSRTIIPEKQRIIMEPTTEVVVDHAALNATRTAELQGLNKQYPEFFNERSLQLAINLGETVETAKRRIADAAITAAQRSDVPSIADDVFGKMTEKDLSRYSLVGAYRAAANVRTPGVFKGKLEGGFEREIGVELVKAAGERGVDGLGAGIPIPSFRTLAAAQQRAITSGGNAGTATNFTVVNADPIELLRARTVLLAMGARMMTGLHGAVQMTKQTAAGTSNWVTEGTAATETDPQLGFFIMKPNRLTMYNAYSRDFLAQSALAVDSFLSDDRLQVLSLALDTAGLAGSGTAPVPLGLFNQSGLAGILAGTTRAANGTVTAGAGGVPMTYVDWNNLEAAISTANADIGTMGIITTQKVRASQRSTPKVPASGFGGFVWPDSPVDATGAQEGPLGYRSICTSNSVLTGFTANSVAGCHAAIMGVFNQILFGDWGLSEVIADPYTGAQSAVYKFTEHAYYDINVRHVEAFAACTSALPQ